MGGKMSKNIILNDLEENFETDMVKLLKVGSIFRCKEYLIGEFYKENLNRVKEIYGEYEVDYYSYENGIIVLNLDD